LTIVFILRLTLCFTLLSFAVLFLVPAVFLC
jgi:hypothetical protein